MATLSPQPCRGLLNCRPGITPAADGIRPAGPVAGRPIRAAARCDLCPRGCHLRPGDARLLLRPPEPRRPHGLDHLRPQHRLLHRPDREEAAEPFLSRHAGALVRHGRLQPRLQVLPELGHLEVARRRAACEAAPPEAIAAAAAAPRLPQRGLHLQRPVVWAEYAIDTARACHEPGSRPSPSPPAISRPRPREPSTSSWTPPTSI